LPDLILCDVNMEEINGLRHTRRFTGNPCHRRHSVHPDQGFADPSGMRQGMELWRG
jgi:CheY-like chemotaxis protein